MLYSEYKKTNKKTNIEGCDNWLVAPIQNSRDAIMRESCNWDVLKELVEDIDYEIHRFNHWGCGWFEIMILVPSVESIKLIEDVEAKLEHESGILDFDAYCDAECEAMDKDWKNYGRSDCINKLKTMLESDLAECIGEPAYPDQHFCQHWKGPISLCTCEDCVITDEQIRLDAIDKLDDDDLHDVLTELSNNGFTENSGTAYYDIECDVDTIAYSLVNNQAIPV